MGTDGDDVIFALGGNDTVTAGNGDDVIYGGSGNDYLDGGNDTIYAGDGAVALRLFRYGSCQQSERSDRSCEFGERSGDPKRCW